MGLKTVALAGTALATMTIGVAAPAFAASRETPQTVPQAAPQLVNWGGCGNDNNCNNFFGNNHHQHHFNNNQNMEHFGHMHHQALTGLSEGTFAGFSGFDHARHRRDFFDDGEDRGKRRDRDRDRDRDFPFHQNRFFFFHHHRFFFFQHHHMFHHHHMNMFHNNQMFNHMGNNQCNQGCHNFCHHEQRCEREHAPKVVVITGGGAPGGAVVSHGVAAPVALPVGAARAGFGGNQRPDAGLTPIGLSLLAGGAGLGALAVRRRIRAGARS